MKIFSPSNIELLLHYYSNPAPHPRADAPAIIDGTGDFLHAGAVWYDAITARYRTTKKGDAWVKALCNVECPREVYIDQLGNILE